MQPDTYPSALAESLSRPNAPHRDGWPSVSTMHFATAAAHELARERMRGSRGHRTERAYSCRMYEDDLRAFAVAAIKRYVALSGGGA